MSITRIAGCVHEREIAEAPHASGDSDAAPQPALLPEDVRDVGEAAQRAAHEGRRSYFAILHLWRKRDTPNASCLRSARAPNFRRAGANQMACKARRGIHEYLGLRIRGLCVRARTFQLEENGSEIDWVAAILPRAASYAAMRGAGRRRGDVITTARCGSNRGSSRSARHMPPPHSDLRGTVEHDDVVVESRASSMLVHPIACGRRRTTLLEDAFQRSTH